LAIGEVREGEQQAVTEGKTVYGEQELWKRTWLSVMS
jgi:hypothetical protein